MGLVPDVFKEGMLQDLKGTMGIGHVRYSTTGSSMLRNAQPFLVEQIDRIFALGHNGNIVECSRNSGGSSSPRERFFKRPRTRN